MKRQWKKFLKENESSWSYGFVPALVNRLESAMANGNDDEIKNNLDGLAEQGVILNSKGELTFLMAEVTKNIINN